MQRSRLRKIVTNGGVFCLIAVASFILVRCGGSNSMAGTGTANVSLSDPPSCTNQFSAVYVTITGVMAHTSASAAPNAAGWQNLTTQLSLSSPVQLNLFNLNSGSTGECLLKALGSDQSLPQGSYQQIRLMLADNGGSAPTVSGNACTNAGLPSGTVDCVEDSTGQWYPLDLSSQDITGLKIPPGQIVGGPINVSSGQTVDININFNTCSSLVPDPANGSYRLKPTLTASQVQPNTTGISGTVYSATSLGGTNFTVGSPLGDATVKLELPGGPIDTTNQVSGSGAATNTVFDTAVTGTDGNFYFCPLNPDTNGLDVVADAPAPPPPGVSIAAVSGATIVEAVANGAKVQVPVITEGGITSPGAGTYSVTLTASQAASGAPTSAFTVDEDLLPLQFTSPTGYEFIVPRLNGSTAMPVEVNCTGGTGGTCTVATSPASVLVPANSPLVGQFSNGSINWLSGPTFTVGTASTGSFAIEANSSTSNSPSATCDVAFSPQTSVTAGGTTNVTLTLTNCQ